MIFHKANRVTIPAEKLIQDGITKIIDEEGAKGYSVFEGGGRGRHGIHSMHPAPIVDDFVIVKIETVVAKREVAEAIAERVAATYFKEYPGIVYLDTVDILRPEKFDKDA